MQILETQRLSLHQATTDDAQFIYNLLTDKTFIDNIADKGIKNLDDAKRYINDSLIKSYQTNGFGLYLTKLKSDGTNIGICGLLKRPELEWPDIGYAFLPQYTGQGYAIESAKAVMDFGQSVLKMGKIVGITVANNKSSIKVLEKLGLRTYQTIRYMDSDNLLFVPE